MTAVASQPDYSFAFQPIVDAESGSVFAYEALIRGPGGETANTVLGRYQGRQLHILDRDARLHAVRLAASLGLQCSLSLNFMPHSLEELPDAVSSTIDAAVESGIPLDHLVLEITEGTLIKDPRHLAECLNTYRSRGIKLAIDDFGAGYAGLNLLADFQPDIVKIDMDLVRDIDKNGPRQAIARAVTQVCAELGLDVIAEGIETEAEQRWFARRGVRLFQGYWLGRPAFRQLLAPDNLVGLRRPRPTAVA